MFAKLLKHEWRATRGIIGLLCAIILGSGVAVGAVIRYLFLLQNKLSGTVTAESPVTVTLCLLVLMMAVIAIGVCCTGSVFFLVYRFYKSRFTDEGYLTFTLPVTHHQLLLSSLTNTVIGTLIVGLTAMVAVAIAMVLFALSVPRYTVSVGMADMWGMLWLSVENALSQYGGEMAVAFFSAISAALGMLINMMLSVTIGALIAKKHKILTAIAVYYGINIAISFASTFVSLAFAVTEQVTGFVAVPGIMGLAIAVGGYFLMHYLTSRKLNLT